MPELPEVETVRNVLKKKILNKKIKEVNVYYEKIVENNLMDFKSILSVNEFLDIKRRGKYLIFELEKHYLISHLRMEGKYFYKTDKSKILKHEHVEIKFIDDSQLIYHDTRKFGRMKLIEKSELEDYFKNLGVEPKNLNVEYLIEKMKKKGNRKCIKTLLLDQSIIAGLGNIYANEVLYKSLINPYKLGKELSEKELKKIINASRKIIEKSIEEGGCTIKSYTSSLGVTGNYQNYLCVHMRENAPCLKCGTLIKKEKIDGRSTYYCENCQNSNNI